MLLMVIFNLNFEMKALLGVYNESVRTLQWLTQVCKTLLALRCAADTRSFPVSSGKGKVAAEIDFHHRFFMLDLVETKQRRIEKVV